MSFEHDAMISYSWRDNEPPPLSNEGGWVSTFQEGLEYWLRQLMPRNSKIWRDKNNVQGNTMLAEEMHQVLGKCAILLAVTSEPYLASEWCKRELTTFLEQAESQGGVRVDNDYRIFKINKLPVEREALPKELDVTTGFDFYEIDPDSRMPTPLDPTFGESERRRFIRKVYDVAVTLSKILKQIENKGVGPNIAPFASLEEVNAAHRNIEKPQTPSRSNRLVVATVYVPHTSKEQREVRDEVVGELIRRNCLVLPQEQGQFSDAEEFLTTAKRDLAKCDFSIHLIGARYGIVLEGSPKSMVELQNEWAAEESRTRGMKRLIWIPNDLKDINPLQATFIESLRTESEAIIGADLVEDAAEVLLRQMAVLLKSKRAEFSAESMGLKIYLMHEEPDMDEVRELRRYFKGVKLNGHPLEILLPIFDGDAHTLREMQLQNLMEADTVLIFWNSGSQAWVKASLNEVRKAKAMGRQKPYLANHLIYLTGEMTNAKRAWWLDFQEGLYEAETTTIEAYEQIPEIAFREYFKHLG
jgi:hypothetical protein